ncbi:MAG: LCP family protein [Acidimicrobiaceae bacterium]|nr:LCP family protein [Acidimicrobiaceae bacterium]
MTGPTQAPGDRDPYINLRRMGRGSRSLRPDAPGRRRWPRRMLIVANVCAALTLLSIIGAFGYVTWRLSQIHKEDIAGLTASSGGGFTMLVVGSDTRSLHPGPCDDAGTAQQTPGQRSDTIMLVRVVPSKHQLSLLSIPRDLWVNIPGMGHDRVNTAFNTGPSLLVRTIQTDLGIPINHYAEVNFQTFCDVTNAVGGVKFWFPTPARDIESDLRVPQAGCVNLTGQQALAFVRSRHYEYFQNGQWRFEGESDLARIQRQQAFVKKMIHKAVGDYTNPIAINKVIGGVTKNLTVDSRLSTTDLLELAKDFRAVDAAGIPSQTLPTYSFTTSGGADVLGLQQPQAQHVIAAFNALGTKPKTSKPKAASTTTSPPTPPVNPSSVSIAVRNGSGVTGQAGRVTQDLQALGYRASIAGDISGFGYTTTTIKYAPGSLDAARQLASQIRGGTTLVADPALASTSYNLVVVTGGSYAGAGSTAAAPTPPAPTAPAPTPPTTQAPYVLPGTPPGQLPPANC